MNCLEFQKLLLADPRTRTSGQEAHAAECPACAKLARETDQFEARVHQALQVPVPDALADRVLLRRKVQRPALRVWALAASLAVVIGAGLLLYYRVADMAEERVLAAAAVGATHPAVAAIAYVADYESQLLKEGRSGDPAVMRSALARLGLKLPATGVTVRYLGKCPVPVPSGSGEHIVLQTDLGRATLILVPDDPLGSRVTVADRQMTALASSRRSGGYIVISDSPDRVRRVEKMLM